MESLKILKEIRTLGCKSDELCAATYRIYLDLCEVRKYEIVSYHYTSELDSLYLIGLEKADHESKIYIPVLSTQKFSFSEFSKYQKHFATESIYLAIIDTSSTILYYKLNCSN